MAKFKFDFKHTVEEMYEAEIEADTLEEAKAIFDEEPFEHLTNDEPYDVQGLNIEIEKIEKVEEVDEF